MPHPVFRCFELQNLASRIDRLAAELAEFVCILRDDLVSEQVTLQHITGCRLSQGVEERSERNTHKGWSLKPPIVVGIPSVNWFTTSSSSSTSSRCFSDPDHMRLGVNMDRESRTNLYGRVTVRTT